MKKQLIVSVSAAFQAFVLKTCAENTGAGVTKDTNLTQVELSNALLAFVNSGPLFAHEMGIDPETGEECEIAREVSLDDFITEILESREVGGGTRESAKSKLGDAVAQMEKMIAELKSLGARPAVLAPYEADLARLKGKAAVATPPPLPAPVEVVEGQETPVTDEIPA